MHTRNRSLAMSCALMVSFSGLAMAEAPAKHEHRPVMVASLGLTVPADHLEQLRGGASPGNGNITHIRNESELKGAVADNVAIEVVTGSNTIGSGAFSNASGLPMAIQNSGNNVLIQNSTIINIQMY